MTDAKTSMISKVKERYGRIAREGSSCCGTEAAAPVSIGLGYDSSALDAIPKEADLGLGCGAGAEQREDYFDIVRAAGLENVEVLKDVDFAAAVPEDARAILDDAGVSMEEVAGKVRSITFRATKS